MLWVLLVAVVLAVVFGPTFWVRWVMSTYNTHIEGMPGTGGQLAKHLVRQFKLTGVEVEVTPVGDHYDPVERKVKLSEANYAGKSLTAIAVSAHEVGHAIQHHRGDRNLALRTTWVPISDRVARVSTGLIWAAPIIGLITQHPVPVSVLVLVGMSGLVARMLVHLVTLPTEWDASFGKALPALIAGQYVAPGEDVIVRRILRAAALTYFAAALADILNLVRWAALLLRR